MNDNEITMYNFCVTGDVVRCLEGAISNAYYMELTQINTVHFLAAAFKTEKTLITNFFDENGIIPNEYFLMPILKLNPQLFSEVFGVEESDKYFAYLKDLYEDNEDFDEELDSATDQEDQDFENLIIQEIQDMEITYSEEFLHAYTKAVECVKSNNVGILDLNNLIYTMISQKDTYANKFMKLYFKEAINPLNKEISFEDVVKYFQDSNIIYSKQNKIGNISLPSSLSFCEIENDKYIKGEESDILNRDQYKKRIWGIISKRYKRNVILTGSSGVGKTAIVESMAQDIVNGDCPKMYKDYTIISLNVSSMISDTMYRGQFEKKVDNLIEFLKTKEKVILFIDEIHQIVGVGSTHESAFNFAEALKPILAREKVCFIGTTTINELNNHIFKNEALSRRFEVINVKEPKRYELKEMISKRVTNLQRYHNVKISDEVLDYVITCAYVTYPEISNPDRTVNFLDTLLGMAKIDNKRVVNRKYIDSSILGEFFKKKKLIPRKELIQIAYHEAGHFICINKSLTNQIYQLQALSIVPTSDCLGCTMFEYLESSTLYTYKICVDIIASDFAGRIAENLRKGDINNGVRSDLEKATKFAKKVIMEYGISKNQSRQYTGLYDESVMSDQERQKLNDEVVMLAEEGYQRAVEIVQKYKKEIEILANTLLKMNVMSYEEVDKIFNTKDNEKK